MNPLVNKQIHLAARPGGEPRVEHFRLVETPVPRPADGQLLVRHHYLSLDPYMRGRMNEGASYAPPQPLNEVMIGGTVGEVVDSCSARFEVGDTVLGMGGWQQYQVVDVSRSGSLQKVSGSQVPLSAYLGVLGMPGVTAWYGLLQVIAPKSGETLVVSAASGAVGSVVGQLAKIHGCRAVGIAGGPQKCRLVVDDYGFDACIDHKRFQDVDSLSAAIAQACPDGVDAVFENVGGIILDAVMQRCNAFARIALCGMIACYNGEPSPIRAPWLILVKRLQVEGFVISEHMEVWPEALRELGMLVGSGTLKYRETVAQGIERAPEAFIGLLKGANLGKQLVRLI